MVLNPLGYFTEQDVNSVHWCRKYAILFVVTTANVRMWGTPVFVHFEMLKNRLYMRRNLLEITAKKKSNHLQIHKNTEHLNILFRLIIY